MKVGTRLRWALGGGAIILVLLAGIGLGRLIKGTEDDGTLERVKATGELRVGLDASFPPFESLDATGNVVGVDADLAHAIATALGAEPVFVNIGFDGLYDALLAGRVDAVISGLPYDPLRTQDVIYSEPYFNAGQLLVVRASDTTMTRGGTDHPPVSEYLRGRAVAVEWGSLADMEGRRLRQVSVGMQILPQPTAQEALTALASGQADAAIADAVSVYQFLGQDREGVHIAATLTDEPYVIATRMTSRQLAEAINQALAALRESGELDQLKAKWF